MDSAQIIAEFKQAIKVPVDAVREAEQRREEMVPLLNDIIAHAAKAPLDEVTDQEGLVFMAFHLLGSWRVTSAYHVVADLLGSDSEKVEWLLGDAVTITSHKVMFNLFDGDMAPLKRLIENPDVDVYVRRRMFDLLGMLMLRGKLERDELVSYLRDLHGRLEGDPEGLVWAGWAELIAQVGFRELTDLVDESFQAKKIEPMFISRTDFYRILRDAEAGQVMQGVSREFEPFGDLVEELGDWTIRDDWDDKTEAKLDLREELDAGGWGTGEVLSAIRQAIPQTVSNPYRHVGRNDPCPCGSGKKFKRCCGQ
jgi:hypothetical protein